MNGLASLASSQGLLIGFALIGAVMLGSEYISRWMTRGRIHASAIAILIGLVLAYVGGVFTQGSRGLADITLFTGVSVLGGAMLRDFAIVATAFDVSLDEAKRAGAIGAVAIAIGIFLPFAIGAGMAWSFGYTDVVSITTIGAGAVTYIVGPVTGAALDASSPVLAISIAIGVLKAILVMTVTPFVASRIGLTTPRAAMVFGGVMGTTSGVTAGLAATDPKLVPYGALTSTFYTGVGCLVVPSIFFLVLKALFA